ncbi:hypothetical protein ACHWQZ_G010812 [Mnemiopsis leidyi]
MEVAGHHHQTSSACPAHIKSKLQQYFNVLWETVRHTSSKLSYYNQVKITPHVHYKDFLDLVCGEDRKCLMRLRSSSHRLNCETGRYVTDKELTKSTGTKSWYKRCEFCTTEETKWLSNLPFCNIIQEDEHHVLISCPRYHQLRTELHKDTKSLLLRNEEHNKLYKEPHFFSFLSENLIFCAPAEEVVDFSLLESEEKVFSFDYLSDDDEPPSMLEIEEALKKLKNYKSNRLDEISNEQLKYGAPGIVPWLRDLFDSVWKNEEVPSDWRKGIITIIPKKGDLTFCNNNRGIALRSSASKLFQIVLLRRLSAGLENLMRENQCGFRRNRSCIDQLYSLHCIIHNCIEFNLPLYINFIDFKAAFDSINRDFIWKAFEHYGLPDKYIKIFQAFFKNTESAVRVNGELTRWFNVDSGTGQGDVQGPPIFNVVINWGLELAEKFKTISCGLTLQHRQSSRQPEKCVTDLDYADDIVDGNPVKQVTQFTYLGATITSDGKIEKEISVRIGKATGAFNQLNNIWKNKNISINNKVRIYVAGVITILTYGCETKKRLQQKYDWLNRVKTANWSSIRQDNRTPGPHNADEPAELTVLASTPERGEEPSPENRAEQLHLTARRLSVSETFAKAPPVNNALKQLNNFVLELFQHSKVPFNLSPSEARGLKLLKTRRSELHISVSDKGGEFLVMKRDDQKELTSHHIASTGAYKYPPPIRKQNGVLKPTQHYHDFFSTAD